MKIAEIVVIGSALLVAAVAIGCQEQTLEDRSAPQTQSRKDAGQATGDAQSLGTTGKDTNNMVEGMERFEIVKFGPYRFIGKSVYFGNKKGLEEFGIFDYMWDRREWVFNELDGIKEYNSDEPHNAALVSWDRYDEKNQLLGYSVGRFMKAGTPVPDGLDYIDIPETYLAKAWWRADNADGRRGGPKNLGKWFAYKDALVSEEIDRTGTYKSAHWIFMAEVHPDQPAGDGLHSIGTYIPCIPLTEQEKAEREKS